jgi:hypothetical protein
LKSIRRSVVIVLLCVVSGACTSNSEKLTKETQTAASWIASTQMVAKYYSDGAVPKAYAHDALESFNQQLQSTITRIQSISEPRAVQTAAALQRGQQAITQMNESIERDDRLSLAQFEVQLDNAQKQLAPVANPQSAPGQP